jgi:hypothetical protein
MDGLRRTVRTHLSRVIVYPSGDVDREPQGAPLLSPLDDAQFLVEAILRVLPAEIDPQVLVFERKSGA